MKTQIRYPSIAATLSLLGCLSGCVEPGTIGPNQAPQASDLTADQALTVCAGGPVTSGIDISNNNGSNFDLAAQKANGVRFVYLKASEGDFFTDDTYDGYRKKAEKLGLIHGAYHFFHPEEDPKAQADRFLGVIGSAPKGDMPPALDWERSE